MGEKKAVEALIEGGKATGGPPLGPALSPLGVNVPMIVNRINELTKDYGGMKVPVKVIVDVDTKEFEVEVGTPTTSALVVKELGVEKGSGKAGQESAGNLTMEQVVKIAKIKAATSYAKTMKACIKEVLGVCQSMGVTVDGLEAKEAAKRLEAGEFKLEAS